MLLSLYFPVSTQHGVHNGYSRGPQDGGGRSSRVWRVSQGRCDMWGGDDVCHLVGVTCVSHGGWVTWGGLIVLWALHLSLSGCDTYHFVGVTRNECLLVLLKTIEMVTCNDFVTAVSVLPPCSMKLRTRMWWCSAMCAMCVCTRWVSLLHLSALLHTVCIHWLCYYHWSTALIYIHANVYAVLLGTTSMYLPMLMGLAVPGVGQVGCSRTVPSLPVSLLRRATGWGAFLMVRGFVMSAGPRRQPPSVLSVPIWAGPWSKQGGSVSWSITVRLAPSGVVWTVEGTVPAGNGLKTLAMFRPECTGLLQGQDRSWWRAQSINDDVCLLQLIN